MLHKDEAEEQLAGSTGGREGGKSKQPSAGLASSLKYPALEQNGNTDKYPLPVPEKTNLFSGNETRANQPAVSANRAARITSQNGTARELANLSDAVIQGAISRLWAYLKGERERYWPQGRHLNAEAKALFARFFAQELLEEVRVVALTGRRLANPPFYETARKLGIANLPDLAHTTSVTYLDVIVFNEEMTSRALFHSLVHAAQVRVLGPRFYSELFVRGVIRERSYPLAPMKAQAFALDTRFATNPEHGFSVEGEIRAWFNEARY
ncbi:MAG: hypothetical protein ACRD51_01730 [Candidatus Acidiferrum sp.]